ncbi:MAG: hypothetical protein H6707_06715 [Deltaproteobacteria bacterium]|nr:hypothetical protein [Deltaproteobacteria bacterium]
MTRAFVRVDGGHARSPEIFVASAHQAARVAVPFRAHGHHRSLERLLGLRPVADLASAWPQNRSIAPFVEGWAWHALCNCQVPYLVAVRTS